MFPDAECITDGCGGCTIIFVRNGRRLTKEECDGKTLDHFLSILILIPTVIPQAVREEAAGLVRTPYVRTIQQLGVKKSDAGNVKLRSIHRLTGRLKDAAVLVQIAKCLTIA